MICNEPEPLGLSICPDCGGAAHAVGDTLIFVKPSQARGDKLRMLQALKGLLSGRAHKSEKGLVAGGHRALIRVPKAAADTVVRQLALHGVPAEARGGRFTWTSVPLSFYLVLLAMLLVGTWASIAAAPTLRIPSILLPLVLLLAAQLRLQQPAIVTPTRRHLFSAKIERQVIETFALLPVGQARDLLAELVRTAEPVYRALRQTRAVAKPSDIHELVSLACRAAVDLSDLESALADLAGDPSADRAQRLRQGLVERFRQGTSVLHRLRVEAVDADPARDELQNLVVRMDEETKAIAEARLARQDVPPFRCR